MFLYFIQKIMSGLLNLLELPHSHQVLALVRKMHFTFEEHWGCEKIFHLEVGRGIPKIALITSMVVSRYKFGAGLSEADKTII
jgi:hypothetical protein